MQDKPSTKGQSKEVLRVRGRAVTQAMVEDVRAYVERYWGEGRSAISRRLCERWGWVCRDGRWAERACREVLLRLEAEGAIKLPPRRGPNYRGQKRIEPGLIRGMMVARELRGEVSEYREVRVIRVENRRQRVLWSTVMATWHPLGCPSSVGHQVRYMIWLDGYCVGAIGFGPAAWRVRVRDEWIGWDDERRRRGLDHITNNVRFLIFPHVHVRCLASKALSIAVRQVREDWERRYKLPLYLVETFVDLSMYTGTCYRAANWLYPGRTSGHARQGRSYVWHGKPKGVFIYPVVRHAREKLCGHS